jgi:phenylpropionate dioxygenase-like ring-hydroxylating dioxygenase large terminal subunit
VGDGRLAAVPHEGGFAGIERQTRGLVAVPTAVAAGLVFVLPSPGFDLGAWLGPLSSELEGLGVASAHAHRERRFDKACSWKLAIDVFLETYHLRPTHGRSIYRMFFDNVGLVDRIGPHLRTLFPKRSIRELAAEAEETWCLRRHANVLYHLFPSTLVLVEPDHAAVVHVLPDGPARSALRTYMLVPEPPETEKALAYWAANDEILTKATEEDFAMAESIQRGLASGANEDVVFGAFEHALAHFHAEIERRLD